MSTRRLLLALHGGLDAEQHKPDGEADEGDGKAVHRHGGDLGAHRRHLSEGEGGGGGLSRWEGTREDERVSVKASAEDGRVVGAAGSSRRFAVVMQRLIQSFWL